MSFNAAILTGTARQVTEQDVNDYLTAVAAHVGGDWSTHTCLQVHATAFTDSSGHVASNQLLRLSTHAGGTPVVLAVPFIVSTTPPEPNGIVPFITRQPVSATVQAGSEVTFTVSVVSASPLAYQWFNVTIEPEPLDGATSSTLLLTNVKAADAGQYRCEIVNSFGVTLCDTVELKVT